MQKFLILINEKYKTYVICNEDVIENKNEEVVDSKDINNDNNTNNENEGKKYMIKLRMMKKLKI